MKYKSGSFFTSKQERYRSLRAVSFLVLLIVFLTACGSTGLRVSGSAPLQKGEVLLSGRLADKPLLASVSIKGVEKAGDIFSAGSLRAPVKLSGRKGPVFFFETAQGLLLVNRNTKKQLLLPCKPGGLKDEDIRHIGSTLAGRELRLYVSYYAPNGAGVTECRINGNLTSFQCRSFDMKISGLKSDRVHEVVPDHKGSLWFRYSPRDLAGVSRLKKDGTWQHYDRNNSELGDNAVSIIKIEKKYKGFPGDNIWFVSRAGLSRLRYDRPKEEWKLYGDKHSFSDSLANAMGVKGWFSKAIVNIVDLKVEDRYLMIATRHALYRFEDGKVNRFVPKAIGGLEELRIRRMWVKDNVAIAVISPQRDARRTIVSVAAFKLKERTWHSLKYWHIAKGFPRDMEFIVLDKNHDLVVLTYHNGNMKLALLSYKDLSLKPLEIFRPAGAP